MSRIVFIKLGAVGDMVQCLPALKAVKMGNPSSPLTVVTTRWSAPLLKLCEWIDEVIPAPGTGEARGPARVWAWGQVIRALRARKPEVVVVGHRNRLARRVAWLTGAPDRVGFDYRGQGWRLPLRGTLIKGIPRWGLPLRGTLIKGIPRWGLPLRGTLIKGIPRWGLTRSVPYPEQGHEVDRYAGLVEALGYAVKDRQPRLTISETLKARVGKKLGLSSRRYLGVHIGGGINPGTTMTIKRWEMDRWKSLCTRLQTEAGVPLLFVGGPGDRDATAEVTRALKSPVVDVTAAGLDVTELTAAISGCVGYVGGDSGPLHLAAAVGVPTVGLFGPTDPAQWAPRGANHRVVWNRVSCAPCYTPRTVWDGQDFSTCPVGTHICMKGLEVEVVWSAVKEMLANVNE